MILAGIDEAGYGPTLGPLVVSAAVFRVNDERPADTRVFWDELATTVTRKRDKRRIPVNDSKKIHRPGKGLGPLEEGVLPFLLAAARETDEEPTSLRALLRLLERSPRGDAYLDAYPWYEGRELEIPRAGFATHYRTLASRLSKDLVEHGIEFLGFGATPIEVLDFNRVLAETANKAAVPFQAIGGLLVRLWRAFPTHRVDVVIDRQGGRINYAELLFRQVQPRGIRIEAQGAEASIYSLRGEGEQSMRVTFTREGDSKSFAVALASMLSKYLRELHMELFNEFWRAQGLTLRPTAGYPTDARRFLDEIAETRTRLDIRDELLIRRR